MQWLASLQQLEWQQAWVFALLPLPLLAFLIPRAQQSLQALRLPFFNVLDTRSSRPRMRWYWLLVIVPVWLLLVAAAAGPIEVGKPIALPSKGRDILMAIDLSGSMEQRDMSIGRRSNTTRLAAVQHVAGNFIKRRKGDRLGLVLFGDNAYLQSPVTPDRRTVYNLLKEAELGLAGGSTAIGDGISIGVKHLMNRPEENRILILLTDGENTSGAVQPIDAATIAAEAGVKIYTIGFGGGDFFGRRVESPTLQKIAELTGGRYFHASDTSELARVYAELDELEPVADDAGTFRPREAHSHKLLGYAAMLALFSMILTVIIKAVQRV